MIVTYFDGVRQEWNDLTDIPDGRKPHAHCKVCNRWLPVFPYAKPGTWAGELCSQCNEQANKDRMARELYQRHGSCGACRKSIALADALLFRCPHCGALYLAGMMTPDEGREMLATLKARRVELKI